MRPVEFEWVVQVEVSSRHLRIKIWQRKGKREREGERERERERTNWYLHSEEKESHCRGPDGIMWIPDL